MATKQRNVWVNRTEIKSETSDRVYVVSQHRAKRFWGCSCPGWRAHRRCKHLAALGLPAGEVPLEVEKGHPAKPDFLAAYPTYYSFKFQIVGTGDAASRGHLPW